MDTRLAPGLLIAMPQLGDPSFHRAVVLLIHHDEDGAMGLVVNRRSEVTLEAFCRQQELEYSGDDARRLHVGGPCELQRAFLLYQEPGLATHELELVPGVHLTTEIQTIRAVLGKGGMRYTFMLGYAGWGAGQLEQELAEGAWLTSEAVAGRVFDADADGMWTWALGDLGVDPARLAVSFERH